MKKILPFVFPLFVLLFGAHFVALSFTVPVSGNTYYISPDGEDTHDGLSASSAWKTLDKVSATTFQPGDKILFESGGVWNGHVTPQGSGTEGNPIIVDQYGNGDKPIIHGPGTEGSSAFSLYNQSYWEVNNLEVTNKQPEGGNNKLWGIKVGTNQTVEHIYIKHCFVHDVEALTNEGDGNFSKGTGGIIFTGHTNNVLIQHNHVKDVAVEGIRNSSSVKCSHFVIDNNLIEDIYGDGIVFHGVKEGSAITHNTVRNVASNTSSANYAGVWTYLSSGTRIAYNEVSGITGGGVNDGQPFDADIDTDGDIFEYNYSHDNGSGFMLFMPNAKNIIVRFNISVNDISKNSKESKKRFFNYTGTGTNGNKIYNNTFVLNNDVDIQEVFGGGFNGLFSNNIIYTTGTIDRFSESTIKSESVFENNIFYPESITDINGPNGTVSGNKYIDPVFKDFYFHGNGIENAANAFALKTYSPALYSGTVISNNGGKDFAGLDISNSVSSTIGAVWSKENPKWNISVLKVDEDTYTFDRNGSINYGHSTKLLSKFGAGYAAPGVNNYIRRTYLKFSTDSIKKLSNVGKLLVRVRYYHKDANHATTGTQISLSGKSSWSESDMTWNSQDADAGVLYPLSYTLNDGSSRPSSTPSPISDEFITENTHYMYLDVTDTVLAMIEENAVPEKLSFVLQGISTSNAGTSVGNTGFTYFSKEFKNAAGEQVDSLAPNLLVYVNPNAEAVSQFTFLGVETEVINRDSIQLKWKTSHEEHIDHFAIQRGTEANSFSPIQEVDANGDNAQTGDYDYMDPNLTHGTYYYRLFAISENGDTVAVSKTTSKMLNLWKETAVVADEDAYTFDRNGSTNYGTAPSLTSKFGGGYAQEGTSTAKNYSRRTYLKFSTEKLKEASELQKVYIRMRYYGKENNTKATGIKISLSEKASWSESEITWDSQDADGGTLDSIGYVLDDGLPEPSSAPSPITNDFINQQSRYIYLDVTDTLKGMMEKEELPDELSFVLQGLCTVPGTLEGHTGYTYFSKDFENENGETVDSLAPNLVMYNNQITTPPFSSSDLTAVLKHTDSIALKWTASNEERIDHYAIDRGTNENELNHLADVTAKGSEGESEEYTYFDPDLAEGTYFYRWSAIGHDQDTVAVSNVVHQEIIASPEVKSQGFQATVEQEKNVKLTWTVTLEKKIKQYEIERSSDGTSFSKIAEISAEGVHNTSLDYSYVDKEVQAGTYTYRWKAIDHQGGIVKISPDKAVKITVEDNQGNNDSSNDAGEILMIYPNPVVVGRDIHLQVNYENAGSVAIKIRDAHGMLVRTLKTQVGEGKTDLKISTLGLSGGLYFLQSKHSENGDIQKTKFIVE